MRSILRIFWPNVINNADLYARTSYTHTLKSFCRSRWGWKDHVLRMPNTLTAKEALYWMPDGKRKQERTNETWCRTVAKKWKKGVGHETIWRSRPKKGLSGGQGLRPFAPKDATWV